MQREQRGDRHESGSDERDRRDSRTPLGDRAGGHDATEGAKRAEGKAEPQAAETRDAAESDEPDKRASRAPLGGHAGGGDATGAEQPDDLAGLSAEELTERVREARRDAQRNWSHFLHSAADLENYKKQALRDRTEAVERTRRQMLTLALTVVDNLERALAFGEAPEGTGRAIVEGLRIAHRQILDQLRAVGVRPIEAVGKPFDPRLHEAVGVVPADGTGRASGTVAGEVLKGYLLNDDVLRPAKVTVVG